jgi:hypothetical protein
MDYTKEDTENSSNNNNNNNNIIIIHTTTHPDMSSLTSIIAPASFKSSEDQALIRLALHRNPWFTCLDEEQIERWVQAAQLQTFVPGTTRMHRSSASETNVISSIYIHRNSSSGRGRRQRHG